MKKIILLLIMSVFVISLQAQERTVERLIKGTYKSYTAVAADTIISTTQDTIDVVFEYTGSGRVDKLALMSVFSPIAGADTTVAISVFGKEFEDSETYTEIIASAVSGEVSTANTKKVQSAEYSAGVLDLSYRFYRVRYIIQGNVGDGIKLDAIEIKLYTNSAR